MGVVSLTAIRNVGKSTVPFITGLKPELKKPAKMFESVVVSVNGWHGAPNDERVTVWFLDTNLKVMLSPTDAEMFEGENVRAPDDPTVTR
jgi:hypothetical protein